MNEEVKEEEVDEGPPTKIILNKGRYKIAYKRARSRYKGDKRWWYAQREAGKEYQFLYISRMVTEHNKFYQLLFCSFLVGFLIQNCPGDVIPWLNVQTFPEYTERPKCGPNEAPGRIEYKASAWRKEIQLVTKVPFWRKVKYLFGEPLIIQGEKPVNSAADKKPAESEFDLNLKIILG